MFNFLIHTHTKEKEQEYIPKNSDTGPKKV